MAIQLKTATGKAVSLETVKAATPSSGLSGEILGVVNRIKKELGPKSIVFGSEVLQVKRLPTGVFEFDLATGGGFPFNRYTIVYGPESSGKTNLLYKAIAEAQRLPPPCNKAVLVDLEGTFDAVWATKFGVDCDELIVVKPSYGEQAVDMIDALIRAQEVAFLAVDSIAVMIAAKEVEGSTEKADVGTSALLIKRLSNKLAIALSEEMKRGHDVAVVLLNQTRFKIGVMFGDPETMPGGQTVKFNASMIVRLYGKNMMVKEISSSVPAFKQTKAVIKKAKIGIVQLEFEYDMVMLEHDGLFVGDTDSFTKVKTYLQNSGDLKKTPKGWELLGKVYPTQAVIQDMYRAEDTFAKQLQQRVISNMALQLVAAQPLIEPGEQTNGGK